MGAGREIATLRRVGFALGQLLGLAAAVTLAAQLLSLLVLQRFVPISLAAIAAGFGLGPADGAELAAAPAGWLLTLPAWIVLGVPAALLLLGRPRPDRFG